MKLSKEVGDLVTVCLSLLEAAGVAGQGAVGAREVSLYTSHSILADFYVTRLLLHLLARSLAG